MIHQTIFQKLDKLGVLAVIRTDIDYAKSEQPGYMPLSLDVLHHADEMTIIALAHNYTQNGDVMGDPDMQIAIHHRAEMAEALTYQQDGLGIYQQVYDQFPEPHQVRTQIKRELNSFLNQWLSNALRQGHRFNTDTEAA